MDKWLLKELAKGIDDMENDRLTDHEESMKILKKRYEDHEKEMSQLENPFKPLSGDEILAELAESRACYERGEYEDFDVALDRISERFGLDDEKESGISDKQFLGFVLLSLGYLEKALEESPDNAYLKDLKDIFESML